MNDSEPETITETLTRNLIYKILKGVAYSLQDAACLEKLTLPELEMISELAQELNQQLMKDRVSLSAE